MVSQHPAPGSDLVKHVARQAIVHGLAHESGTGNGDHHDAWVEREEDAQPGKAPGAGGRVAPKGHGGPLLLLGNGLVERHDGGPLLTRCVGEA